ncbi:MAG: DUF5020 family protein [Prevotellaceae bacterium]|nr:DUF5020 family protein [Candidatus Minthosoma caballi]
MKKTVLSLLLMVVASTAFAQDIQLHYDFGRNLYPNEEAGRPKMTATFEQFKADDAGSWFYFVDMDFNCQGAVGAYTEVSREFNLCNKGFAAHIEYDGGLNLGTTFQHSTLIGPAWNGHNDDFSTTYSVQLMYKQYYKNNSHRAYASAQLTGVWSTTFANKACTFSGFIDLWRGEKFNNHGQLVLLSEPQFWYNLNTIPSMKKVNLSIGTEVEISNNFVFNSYNDKSFFINPTIALKYAF